MKKKILLIAMVVIVLTCLLVVSVSAETITYEGQEIQLVNNLGDPSWYTGTTASKITDKDSIVILKDAEGNMTAYPSYYIFRYLIEGSSVKINWADQKGVDYSFVNGNTTKYTSGSIYYAEIPYGVTSSTAASIWGKTEPNVVELVFPDSMTYMPNNLFENVKTLKKVTMSKNLTTLEMWTFNGAKDLQTVVFPEGSALVTIGKGCFSGCTSLSSINLENCQRLTSIEYLSFYNCSAIDKLSLPDSLKTIGDEALRNLGDLELASNYLPSSLTSVGSHFLAECNIKNDVLYFPAGFSSLSASFCFLTCIPKTSLTLVFLGKMTNVNLSSAYLTNFTNNGDKQPIKLVFAQNQHSDLGGKFFTFVDYNGQNGVIINYADGTKPTISKEGTLTVTLNDSKYSGTQLGKDANNNTVILADSGIEIIFCGGNTVEVSCYIHTRLLDGTLISCHTTSKVYDINAHKTNNIHYNNRVYQEGNCGYDEVTTNTCVICDLQSTMVGEKATGDHNYENYVCTVCGTIFYCSDPTHNLKTLRILYENGFDKTGVEIVKCLDCDAAETEIQMQALFTCLGYSVGPDGHSLKVGFKVNVYALEAYKEFYPNFSFGVVMANAGTVASSENFFVNESLNSTAKGLVIPVDGLKYANLTADAMGFSAEIADSLELVVGIYAKDAENNVVKVCQYENADKYTTTKIYKDMTLNAITFNQVRVGHGYEALVPQPVVTPTKDEQ